MRVTTKIVFDIDGNVKEHEWYEYSGPVDLCGGGPSPEQKAAAARQDQLAQKQAATGDQMLGLFKDQYNKINPFATDRMQNGLPYFGAATDAASGVTARSFAPARAQVMRNTAMFGGSLPNGFQQQQLQNVDTSQAHAYDDELMNLLQQNDQAKVQGAGLLTGQQQLVQPQSYYSGAGSANQSILQAPLQSPGLGGLFGGILGGALSAVPK